MGPRQPPRFATAEGARARRARFACATDADAPWTRPTWEAGARNLPKPQKRQKPPGDREGVSILGHFGALRAATQRSANGVQRAHCVRLAEQRASSLHASTRRKRLVPAWRAHKCALEGCAKCTTLVARFPPHTKPLPFPLRAHNRQRNPTSTTTGANRLLPKPGTPFALIWYLIRRAHKVFDNVPSFLQSIRRAERGGAAAKRAHGEWKCAPEARGVGLVSGRAARYNHQSHGLTATTCPNWGTSNRADTEQPRTGYSGTFPASRTEPPARRCTSYQRLRYTRCNRCRRAFAHALQRSCAGTTAILVPHPMHRFITLLRFR